MFRADPLSVRVRPDFFPLSPDQFRDQEATRAAKAIPEELWLHRGGDVVLHVVDDVAPEVQLEERVTGGVIQWQHAPGVQAVHAHQVRLRHQQLGTARQQWGARTHV